MRIVSLLLVFITLQSCTFGKYQRLEPGDGGVLDKNLNPYWANSYAYERDFCPTSSSVYVGLLMAVPLAVVAPIGVAVGVGAVSGSAIWLTHNNIDDVDCSRVE